MKMMDLPEAIFLDVGHGNCAVIRDKDSVMVIDCPHGVTLLETLEQLSIRDILHILISHSDEDHISGIINLLLNEDFKIHNVHLNPDSVKKTQVWKDLRIALKDARKRASVEVSPELTTTKTGKLNIGSVKIEVLAPAPDLILGGAGGKDLQGRRLTSNSVSAVIGIVHDSYRVAILAADIDTVGWNNLLQETNDLSADILVFPHHGGNPGVGDSKIFAQQLCTWINPKLIIFSIARNRFNNPREEIIDGVVSSVPDAHILCTQLSRKCAGSIPSSNLTHLNSFPAKGRTSNSCCGGTIFINIDGIRTTYNTEIVLHKEFITNQVPTPICRKWLALQPNGTKLKGI